MKRTIVYSAPAKVILTGEHAVVYGKPALVCAIDIRLTITVSEEKNSIVDNGVLQITRRIKKYLTKKNIDFDDKKFSFLITSDIPLGVGLGSSAALSVAAAAAFLEFYTGTGQDSEMINNVAFYIEKIFHGNPAGADTSTACFGGLIFFRREFEFLKTISVLQFKIPESIEKHLYLIDTGRPIETTKEMIETVGKFYNKYPKRTEAIFSDIEKITKRLIIAIIKEDRDFFKKSLLENQNHLERLGVVSTITKALLNSLSFYGTGKVTGAGGRKNGSGYIFFYADKPRKLEIFLKKQSINFIKFKQSSIGIKRE